MDCLTCDSQLHYSHPRLTEKGLFSQEWVDFLKNRYGEIGWRCLQCLGFEHCVACGAKLGEFDRVVDYRDDETGLFCGCEYCADCVIDLIRSPAVLTKFETAHSTYKQARSLQESRQYKAAILKFAEAQNALMGREFRDRGELDDLRADILVGLGSCQCHLGKNKEALNSFQHAEKLYHQPIRRGQTNREAAQLRLLAEMSAVLERMDAPTDWCRHVSAQICDMVDCLPPRDIEPFASMRGNFERFHKHWLSYAISSSAYGLIPEIIAAVQGRDLVSSIMEGQTGQSELATTEAMDNFIQSRRGLRSMLSSDGHASERYLKGMSRKLPNTEGTNFNKDFAGLRRAFQHNKTEAAESGDYSILNSPHRAINAEALQSVLSGKEQLLLLFAHDDEGHAVLMSAHRREISYIHLPSLPSLAEQCVQFDKAGRIRRGMRRNVMFEDDVEMATCAASVSTDPNTFWPQFERDLREAFWARIETKINVSSTLVICCAGELHNLSLEPGRPDKIKLMTRLPGLAYFAISRGLLGDGLVRDHSSPEKTVDISILADNSAKDIPLAGIEGRLVAELWAGTGSHVDFPSSFPESETPIGFLHVASHGMQKAGLLGTRRSSILMGRNPIGEMEIIEAPLAREAFINVCVGGQCEDSPLDGNPTGLVSGFLRRGSRWVSASLLSLPDDWACLFGLIVADIKSTENLPLPEAVERARVMLVEGGWSTRVSKFFAAALIEAGKAPRHSNVSGKPDIAISLFKELTSISKHASFKAESDRTTIFNSMKSRSDLWWLSQNKRLFAKMVATPKDIVSLAERGIFDAITHASDCGLPRTSERDTVRFGMTLFGDPKAI